MIQKLLASTFVLLTIAISPARAQISCEPGIGGVINCPCGNNPVPPFGRGCDNSMGTGGASLTATGSPSLSADSIQFNCTGIGNMGPSCTTATNNVLSFMYEGTTAVAAGIVWGDGVMCTSAPFYFLDAQISNGGIYHWPVAGTTGVSAAAIAAGDPLVAGQTRQYWVAYRDPCPTFCTPSLRQKSNSWSLTWTP